LIEVKTLTIDLPYAVPAARTFRRATLALSMILAAGPAVAARTDVVLLLNGDRITGEVKELAYGQLKFKTDDMGTLYIEWNKIASLTTKQLLQVELADGSRLFGQAPEPGASPGTLLMQDGPSDKAPDRTAASSTVRMIEVMRIATIDRGAWHERLDGSVSAGYSFTQASEVETFNFSGTIGARNRRRHWEVALDGQATSQESGSTSQRVDLSGTLERFLRNRYYYEGTLAFTRNEELGLKLRSLVGGTVGRYLVQRSDREWRAGAGLAISTEVGADDNRRQSVEAVLTTSARIFRFDSPETDVTASLDLLPSLTESGRLRGEASLNLRRELVSDLFFEISIYDSYDNRPSEGAEQNDWSLTTSLGYTF
jgi:hypothetical protein